MKDINTFVVTGRLTDNMKLFFMNDGTPIGKFSIAVNRRKRVNSQYVNDANFFECALFGKAAESLNQYLIKGKQIGISGELRQERWTTDGVNYSRVVLVVNDLTLLGERKQPKASTQKAPSQPKQDPPKPQGPEDFDDDEIPF